MSGGSQSFGYGQSTVQPSGGREVWLSLGARITAMTMVTFFGMLVIPLGHIVLVISQPVLVEAWCTVSLLAAAIMLPMIPAEIDEIGAMGQFLVQPRRRRESLWKTFW